ncbi:MAG: TolC family protein [Sulfurimonas sp.]|nr:TolC family protein [Sulfurimonas sp.]
MKIIILFLVITINIYATKTTYKWDDFIQKAVDASLVLRQNDAQLAIKRSEITQSTLLENPTFEISFDNGLKNSIDYSYLEFTQKLPALGERYLKKRTAQLYLRSEQYSKDATLLKVQYRAASLFQEIYFLKKQIDIVNQQLIEIKDLQKKSKNREELGEISSFENSRIDILKQQVVMRKKKLQNSYIKLMFDTQSLLNIDNEILILGDIIKFKKEEIEVLISSLKKSPQYLKYKAELEATKQELKLVKATRYALPELYVYSERDLNLNNSVDNTYGFGFRLSIPLWDTKETKMEIQNAKIQKSAIKAQEILYKLKRSVNGYHKLYKSTTLQVKNYKINLLEPSKKYYETSVFLFELGESNLLELLDAQALYFQSQHEYQNLISQSHIYWLKLCSVANINLLKDN